MQTCSRWSIEANSLGEFEMKCARIVIQLGQASFGPVNRSPSLDHRAGLFPVGFDHGGPSAIDRLTSSIGVLLPIALCGRSSLYNKA